MQIVKTEHAVVCGIHSRLTAVYGIALWGKMSPTQFLNRKKSCSALSETVSSLVTFPGYGMGTKCNNHVAQTRTDFLKLAKFYAHVDQYDKMDPK